jgi:hypothetical protein
MDRAEGKGVAMSQGDVEIVRRLNETFNRSGEDWFEFYDSTAEVQLPCFSRAKALQAAGVPA